MVMGNEEGKFTLTFYEWKEYKFDKVTNYTYSTVTNTRETWVVR